MAAVKGRDTSPELALRRALHRRGLRFRIHPDEVVGRPDIVNRRRRIAIFVDGDFWHGNPADWKRRGFDSMGDQFRSAMRERWVAKLRRNIERDREVTELLQSEGWTVLRFWESDVRDNLEATVDRVVARWGAPPQALPD